MSDEPVTLFDAATAAEKVDLSVSGLRRLAPIYEAVHGPLPRGGKGSGDSPRLWPQDAVARLYRARTMVAAGMSRSVGDALLAIERGDAPPAEVVTALGSGGNVAEALELVLTEMRESRALNSALRVELGELRGQLAEMRADRQPHALPSTEASAGQPPTAQEAAQGTVQEAAQEPAPVTTVTPNRSAGPFVRAAERLELLLARLLRG